MPLFIKNKSVLINIQLIICIFYCICLYSITDTLTSTTNRNKFDVTVVGYMLYPDGLGRLPIGFIDNLHKELNINFIETRKFSITQSFGKINKQILNITSNQDKSPGKVAILFDAVWKSSVIKMPNSIIKIAYSMFESTQIPQEWVDNLNNYFDAVIVPSPFLIKVYKESGVNIPIFLLPCGMYLEEFLSIPLKSKRNFPFVFGCSSTFFPHKNHKLLLQAFLNKFKNNENIILKLHGRGGFESELSKIIKSEKATNVELISKYFTPKEYLEFLRYLDCYVLLSKGEGFSMSPREALALGIPCILSNNTAHEVLCQTPYVNSVMSNKVEPADYRLVFGQYYGYQFNSSITDVEKSLEEIYNNYDYYLQNGKDARQWVQQYDYRNLKNKYLNLIKPNKVILGKENLITDEYIMTDCKKLYQKYCFIKSLND